MNRLNKASHMIAPGNPIAETLRRFLDGLTTAIEEQQLRSTLETREAHGHPLSDDERAALSLLRLSFPEEATDALLTEDNSSEYEALMTSSQQAFNGPSTSGHTRPLRYHIRRIVATVAAIAAVVMLMITVGKWQRTDIIVSQADPTIAAESNNHQPLAQSTHAERQKTDIVGIPHDIQPKELTTARQATAVQAKPATQTSYEPVQAADPPTHSEQKANPVPTTDSETPTFKDTEGDAILAAQKQRIQEMETEAYKRAIAATQENTLACVTAATPS